MSTSPGLCQNPFPLGNICFGHQPCPAHNTGNYGSYLNRRDLLTGDASFEGMKESGNETFIDALRIWKENSPRPSEAGCIISWVFCASVEDCCICVAFTCLNFWGLCVCVWRREREKEFTRENVLELWSLGRLVPANSKGAAVGCWQLSSPQRSSVSYCRFHDREMKPWGQQQSSHTAEWKPDQPLFTVT